MNTMACLSFVLMRLITVISASSNNVLEIDWTVSASNCYETILQRLKVSNMYGDSDPLVQQQYACTPTGALIKVSDCEFLVDKKIKILSYFYSLPENDASKQCSCQSRCINISVSYYTMKFFVGAEKRYFTTPNACVAYCNKGYEIYPSSYALNSFPYNGSAPLIKPFDTACYNCLSDSDTKEVQMELMKIQLCKADIMCSVLIDLYTRDIQEVELAVYGKVLPPEHLAADSEKFWSKAANGSCDGCLELKYIDKQKRCIETYKKETGKLCFYKNVTNAYSSSDGKSIQYIGAISQVYDCMTDGSITILQRSIASSNIECACKYYDANVELLMTSLDSIYGQSNDRYVVYGKLNYFAQISYDAVGYAINDVSDSPCECDNIEYIYDYFCPGQIYSTCVVNESAASSVHFGSDTEKMEYMLQVLSDPPDLLLGYDSERCSSLNNICDEGKAHELRCVVKIYNSLQYPVVKTDNAFMSCVDDYIVSDGKERLNYYFDCPNQNECDTQACTALFFELCGYDNSQNAALGTLCSKYDFGCAAACQNISQKVCVVDPMTSHNIIISYYDTCVRQCAGVTYEPICDSSNYEGCDNSECQTLLCKDCKLGDGANCDSICKDNTADPCLLALESCKSADNETTNLCVFKDHISVHPFKATEYTKCSMGCMPHTAGTEYIVCEDCAVSQQSCCESYCSSLDDTEIIGCVSHDSHKRSVTQKQKCLNRCLDIEVVELTKSECDDSCIAACGATLNSNKQYCSFDDGNGCISYHDYCVLSCNDVSSLYVECTEPSSYECLMSYCDACKTRQASDGNVNCPNECGCAHKQLKTIEECQCYLKYCLIVEEGHNDVCSHEGNDYQLIRSQDSCLQKCSNIAAVQMYNCDDCSRNVDCCEKLCSDDTSSVCVQYDSKVFYSTVNEICHKSCNGVEYTEHEESACCLQLFEAHESIVCVRDAFSVYKQSAGEYCKNIATHDKSGDALVDPSLCCLDTCLKNGKDKYCINDGSGYYFVDDKQYCERVCNTSAHVDTADDNSCCAEICVNVVAPFLLGSYCDASFTVYDTLLDYCLGHANQLQLTDAFYCGDYGACTLDRCKQIVSDNRCKNEPPSLSVGITNDGKCALYKSDCEAEIMKDNDLANFKCSYGSKEECINSKDFYLAYMKYYPRGNPVAYCNRKEMVTAYEYDYLTKCKSTALVDAEVCDGAVCDDEFCRRRYCKKTCAQTSKYYWGEDCNYYHSKCEVDCLGIRYFDFFDVDQLRSTCGVDDQVNPALMELVVLKSHICFETAEVRPLDDTTNAHSDSFIDCTMLKSENLADCRSRCESFVNNIF